MSICFNWEQNAWQAEQDTPPPPPPPQLYVITAVWQPATRRRTRCFLGAVMLFIPAGRLRDMWVQAQWLQQFLKSCAQSRTLSRVHPSGHGRVSVGDVTQSLVVSGWAPLILWWTEEPTEEQRVLNLHVWFLPHMKVSLFITVSASFRSSHL